MILNIRAVLRTLLASLVLALLMVVGGAGLASASSSSLDSDLPDPIGVDFFAFDSASNVVTLIAWLVPVLVAVVVRSGASSKVKSALMVLSQVVLATINVLVGPGDGFAWQAFLNAFMQQMAPAVVLYYGLYKPTGLTPSLQGKGGFIGPEDPPVNFPDGGRAAV